MGPKGAKGECEGGAGSREEVAQGWHRGELGVSPSPTAPVPGEATRQV